MIYPIPTGTRDILPTEMAELNALSGKLKRAFALFAYREVSTPTMEYEEVLARGDKRAAGASYRVFDEHGDVLALRPDMTIPIARMVSMRYADADLPLRFCYLGFAYRSVEPRRGQQREFLQAGVELIGAPAPTGDAEGVAVLCAALETAGLKDFRIGLGDASLYRSLTTGAGVPGDRLLDRLAARDLVGLQREVEALDIDAETKRSLVEVPRLRGGSEVLDRARQIAGSEWVEAGIERLKSCYALLEEYGVADRVIFDLGLLRELGYYTGVIFEVYDSAFGFAIGGGGRYDELLGRFGAHRPAVGFALMVESLHIAVAKERPEELELEEPLNEGVLLVGGLEQHVAVAQKLREAGIAVDAVYEDVEDVAALAQSRHLRHLVTKTGKDGFRYEAVAGEPNPEIQEVVRQ